MKRFHLKLYVTGRNTLSTSAIANLSRICEERLAGEYEIEIIDILESPQLAEEQRIFATPAVIKQTPPPQRWVIGDLSNPDEVINRLHLIQEAAQEL